MLHYQARAQPLQYPLCTMTATVYHVCFNPFSCRRTVLQGVYYEHRSTLKIGKGGAVTGGSYLLVIPPSAGARVSPTDSALGVSGTYVLETGDRVVAGVGPEISTREQWAALLPPAVDVVTLGWVEQKYLQGVPVHVEAGC